ncbi:MAG: hypothetical protein ABI914_00445 [Acidobacteriota bacterium]
MATAPGRFDRSYFVFLESARRSLPPGTRGVALYAPGSNESAYYLAAYEFAPLPVLLNPPAPPAGWISAAYGPAPPAGGVVVRQLPGGALFSSAPGGTGSPP